MAPARATRPAAMGRDQSLDRKCMRSPCLWDLTDRTGSPTVGAPVSGHGANDIDSLELPAEGPSAAEQGSGACRYPDLATATRSTSRRQAISHALPARVLLGRLRLELEPDELLVPEDPRVVARLDDVGVAGTELQLGAVVVRDVQPAGVDDAHVPCLAGVGAGHRFHALRP